ncbi:MAG: 16S rRNA (uracil(1498)-N(3))-methyltransferase [Gammaproteobacteria bacterium]|nr:16S rRNA (uracil(1498)-N(3))-methyltransferase [Gammaproteobacteria bacterium]
MRHHRAHVEVPLAVGDHVALGEGASAHLLRALRLGVGDPCVLFNGDGNDYDALVTAAGKRGGEARIVAVRPVDNESALRIVLLQGVARGEKMDWILQKATELGVAGFLPVNSQRSEVRLEGERATRRLAHWRGVVSSACAQSGRAVVPTVAPPAPLAEAVAALAGDALKLTLDPGAGSGVAGLQAPAARSVVLAIGPEGGWSPGDRAVLDGAGFTGLRLGPRILRTETAGVAAISVLQSAFGDLA